VLLQGRRHRPRSLIWLISFTDLICLLLAFFVLLFSMAEPVGERWQALVTGFGLGLRDGASGAAFIVETVFPPQALGLGYLAPLLTTQFANDPVLAGIQPNREPDRVIIGLPDHLLFDADDRVFSSGGERIIFVLSGILGRLGNRIEITAHAGREATSTGPGATGPRATGPRATGMVTGEAAWETALLRAVAVAAALRDAGYRRPIVARSRAGMENADRKPRSHLIDIVIREREGP